MKQVFRDYLTFNKRERNGVVVLLGIITLLLVWLTISDKFHETKKVDISRFMRELDSLNALALQDSGEDLQDRVTVLPRMAEQKKAKVSLFEFDPNGLPEADWKRLGFSDKQVRMIKNYESKGGKFRKKEDLKKMYCIKEAQYEMLEPYIRIQPAPAVFENGKVESPKSANVNSAAAQPMLLELNSADSAMLTTIKGIGPFFAKSIIKYRNSLGGFYAKEQLMEIWKFDKEKFDMVEKYISVDAAAVRKVNINTCEAEALRSPYVSWNVANAIVNYRKQHGKFKTIEEIQRTDLVDDETLRKIAPYLTIGEL
ncbi:MAG: uptake protein [Bacteroidetes bacterium]|nr:uptake protein [Bacteroidota bacterium]